MNAWARIVVAATLMSAACLPTSSPTTSADLLERVSRSAVLVRTRTGSGSGTVIFSGPGAALVLTAHHVVSGARGDIRVATSATEVRAERVAADPQHDLALVRTIGPIDSPALPLAQEEPDAYAPLFIVAAPMGLAGTATPATLSAKLARGAGLWQVTGFVFFGSSGGTVVNEEGHLVGVPVLVATWQGQPVAHVGFCVGLSTIRTFLVRVVSAVQDRG